MLLSALGDTALIRTHLQPLLTSCAVCACLANSITSCNAGLYHMAHARDVSTTPEEDALLKRTLLQQDGVLIRQAAMAAGQQALTALQRYYTDTLVVRYYVDGARAALRPCAAVGL